MNACLVDFQVGSSAKTCASCTLKLYTEMESLTGLIRKHIFWNEKKKKKNSHRPLHLYIYCIWNACECSSFRRQRLKLWFARAAYIRCVTAKWIRSGGTFYFMYTSGHVIYYASENICLVHPRKYKLRPYIANDKHIRPNEHTTRSSSTRISTADSGVKYLNTATAASDCCSEKWKPCHLHLSRLCVAESLI